jgi:hypothetical protein
MQSFTIIPIIFVAAVFAVTFAIRGKMRGVAAAMYSGAMDAMRGEVAAAQRPGEAAPILIIATERKMFSAKMFFVGLTDRRVIVKQAGGDIRTFERASVQLAIRARTFTDSGNMTTTISRGWELRIALPDGSRGAWRVYDHAEGIPDHPAHVQALVATLPAA